MKNIKYSDEFLYLDVYTINSEDRRFVIAKPHHLYFEKKNQRLFNFITHDNCVHVTKLL